MCNIAFSHSLFSARVCLPREASKFFKRTGACGGGVWNVTCLCASCVAFVYDR